jgi:hypothetical protein
MNPYIVSRIVGGGSDGAVHNYPGQHKSANRPAADYVSPETKAENEAKEMLATWEENLSWPVDRTEYEARAVFGGQLARKTIVERFWSGCEQMEGGSGVWYEQQSREEKLVERLNARMSESAEGRMILDTISAEKAEKRRRDEEARVAAKIKADKEKKDRIDAARLAFARRQGFPDWDSFWRHNHELWKLNYYHPWWSWFRCIPKSVETPRGL